MKSLFFIFPVAALLTAAATWALVQFFKAVLVKEMNRFKKRKLLPVRSLKKLLLGLSLTLIAAGGAFAFFATGRPILGFPSLFLIPLVIPWVLSRIRIRQEEVLDRSGLSFFYALQGLIEIGMSLPAALFQLTESDAAPYARVLRRQLTQFTDGKSLNECLQRFRTKTSLQKTGMFLLMLEMSYQNGLAIAPLLKKILPLLEAELQSHETVKNLQRTTLAQIILSSGIPFLLGATLFWFQPELLEHFWHSQYFFPVLGSCLVYQSVGVFLIWKYSTFY